MLDEIDYNEINKRLVKSLERATCTKRKVGAVLLQKFPLFYRLTEGWNGPPDEFKEYCEPCPRAESPSGVDMDLCPAIHAEIRAVLNACKERNNVEGSILFMTCGLPCKDCMKELIIAGVKQIVSPYPLIIEAREDGFEDGDTYNFNLAYELMMAAGIEYIHEPRLVKGATAHVVIEK